MIKGFITLTLLALSSFHTSSVNGQVPPECDEPCEEGWFLYKNVKCVKFFQYQNFFDADIYCRKQHAKMLSITTEDENFFIVQNMRDFDIWLGGKTFGANRNEFYWLDREIPNTFNNFDGPIKPDEGIVMTPYKLGKWTTRSFGSTMPFACEMPVYRECMTNFNKKRDFNRNITHFFQQEAKIYELEKRITAFVIKLSSYEKQTDGIDKKVNILVKDINRNTIKIDYTIKEIDALKAKTTAIDMQTNANKVKLGILETQIDTNDFNIQNVQKLANSNQNKADNNQKEIDKNNINIQNLDRKFGVFDAKIESLVKRIDELYTKMRLNGTTLNGSSKRRGS